MNMKGQMNYMLICSCLYRFRPVVQWPQLPAEEQRLVVEPLPKPQKKRRKRRKRRRYVLDNHVDIQYTV